MDVLHPAEAAVSRIAAAIGEPARTRILFCLLDGRARTSTELAVVAKVNPPTASVHLNRLKEEKLIKMQVQGRHRYYSLGGANVARALERLSVLAGGRGTAFVPNTPDGLRAVRTCYDHMAGTLAVRLHDQFLASRWIEPEVGSRSGRRGAGDRAGYEVTLAGTKALLALAIDVNAARALRRRFAYGCLDWSERRPHLGGALGADILQLMLRRNWVTRELESRALSVTAAGKREIRNRFGVEI